MENLLEQTPLEFPCSYIVPQTLRISKPCHEVGKGIFFWDDTMRNLTHFYNTLLGFKMGEYDVLNYPYSLFHFFPIYQASILNKFTTKEVHG